MSGSKTAHGREYPQAPMAGVAAVVVRGSEILLIRRGREPMLGAWSLPGGVLELGETTEEGVVREVFEETAVRVRAVEVITAIDRILREEDGRIRFHYVVVEWLCVVEEGTDGEPICGDDAAEARWVSRDEIGSASYDLGAVTLDVLERALKIAEKRSR